MGPRLVTDLTGSTWQVRAVRPSPRVAAGRLALAPGYQTGWLAFERLSSQGPAGPDRTADEIAGVPLDVDASGEAIKRRLVPIPQGWEAAPEASPLAWLDVGAPVRRTPVPRRRDRSQPRGGAGPAAV